MNLITKKGLTFLSGIALLVSGPIAASASTTGLDEIDFKIPGAGSSYLDYNDLFEDAEEAYFDDLTTWDSDTGLYNEDAFDDMGEIYIQLDNGDLFQAEPTSCSPNPEDLAEGDLYESLSYVCEANLQTTGTLNGDSLSGGDTAVIEFQVTFEGNWFSYEVRAKDSARTNNYRIYILANYGPSSENFDNSSEIYAFDNATEGYTATGQYGFEFEVFSRDAETNLEFSNSNSWLFSDSKYVSEVEGFGRGNYRPIVGFRSGGATILKPERSGPYDQKNIYGDNAISTQPLGLVAWSEYNRISPTNSSSDDIFFQSPIQVMSSSFGQSFKVEGFALGWDARLDGSNFPTVDSVTAFNKAVACGTNMLQSSPFGTKQEYFYASTTACDLGVVEVDTKTVALIPGSNPSRAIGERFTIQGRNLNRIESVTCNGLFAKITSQSRESLSIRVPSGLSGQVSCVVSSPGVSLTANNAFRAIDGPVARYVKSVQGGKVNLRIYNAVGQKVRILVDGVRKTVVTPKKIDTFVQLRNVSVGKHKLVIKTGGKELLNRSFRAR